MGEIEEITYVPANRYIYEQPDGTLSYGVITRWGVVSVSFFNLRKNKGGDIWAHPIHLS